MRLKTRLYDDKTGRQLKESRIREAAFCQPSQLDHEGKEAAYERGSPNSLQSHRTNIDETSIRRTFRLGRCALVPAYVRHDVYIGLRRSNRQPLGRASENVGGGGADDLGYDE